MSVGDHLRAAAGNTGTAGLIHILTAILTAVTTGLAIVVWSDIGTMRADIKQALISAQDNASKVTVQTVLGTVRDGRLDKLEQRADRSGESIRQLNERFAASGLSGLPPQHWPGAVETVPGGR